MAHTIPLHIARIRHHLMFSLKPEDHEAKMPVEVLHTLTEAWVALGTATSDTSNDVFADHEKAKEIDAFLRKWFD